MYPQGKARGPQYAQRPQPLFAQMEGKALGSWNAPSQQMRPVN
jgi:hypothetical protein